MKRIFPILLLCLAFVSCEMEKTEGKVVFISVAIDYNAPDGVNALDNPPEDQRVLSAEIEALSVASGDIYEEYLFLEKNGKRSVNGEEMKWNHADVLTLLSSIDTVSSDLIIFHYSGHGDESGALVTDINTSNRLTPEKLLTALSGADGRKCLFLDSCYSGTFIAEAGYMHSGELFEDGNLVSDNPVNAILPSISLLFHPAVGNDDIWILAAATDVQSSFDSWDSGEPMQENFGAFSYYLARALGYDMENDTPTVPGRGGKITFYGLYQEIKESMPNDLRREATVQITRTHFDPVLFSF